MVGFMPLLVFVASFHNPESVWKIRRFDYACGLMSVVGTVVWLVTRNGVLAISAAIVADFLAGVPTLMKSWTHPETETVHTYVGRGAEHGHLAADDQSLDIRRGGFPTLHRLRGLRRSLSRRL